MKEKLLILLLFAGWAVGAPTYTVLIGDEDGFNLGARPGDSFDWTQVAPGAGDDHGTDTWLFGSRSWEFTFNSLPATVFDSAQLEILHGGDGLAGPSEVLINGTRAGWLTDTYGLPGGDITNVACRDTLDLSPFWDGTSSILLTISASSYDGWAADYLKLTLGGSSFNGSVVPAPSALMLGSTGLLLAGWLRRRKSW